MRRTSLQQLTIHREVLTAEQRFSLRRTHQLLQELPHNFVIDKPFAALGQCAS
jgi:hypothetical protein